MASKVSCVLDNKFDLLYVKRIDKDEVKYLGYKRDYLAQNLTELERGLVICEVCNGIMREASIVGGETTCRVCSASPGELNSVKIVENSVNKLEIKCPLLRNCVWKGKLYDAELHLIDCAYFLIECFDCQQVFPRGELASHEENSCPMRDRESGRIIKENPGKKLDKMECPYSEFGCTEKLMTQHELKSHEEANLIEHTRLSLVQLKEQKAEITLLKTELEDVKWKMRSMKSLDGVAWEITRVDQLGSEMKEGPAFYIHKYKLQCYYQFGAEDNDIKFYLKRIKGESDKSLEKISITQCRLCLINRSDYTKSYYKLIPMNYQPSTSKQCQEFSLIRRWEYKFHLTETNSLLVRMYFDVNTSTQRTSMPHNLAVPAD